MGLMTLDQRRERGHLIEVYKILNGQTRIDPALFWEVREARNGARLVKSLLLLKGYSEVEPSADQPEESAIAGLVQNKA